MPASFLARSLDAAAAPLASSLHEARQGNPVKDPAHILMRDFMTFEDVEAISSNGLGLLCRVNGKEVWVPYATMVTRARTVRRPGDRGLLIVPHWLAVNLQLLDRAA